MNSAISWVGFSSGNSFHLPISVTVRQSEVKFCLEWPQVIYIQLFFWWSCKWLFPILKAKKMNTFFPPKINQVNWSLLCFSEGILDTLILCISFAPKAEQFAAPELCSWFELRNNSLKNLKMSIYTVLDKKCWVLVY